jgi:hypothetical protein
MNEAVSEPHRSGAPLPKMADFRHGEAFSRRDEPKSV